MKSAVMDIDQRDLPIYSRTFVRPVDLLFYYTVRWEGGGRFLRARFSNGDNDDNVIFLTLKWRGIKIIAIHNAIIVQLKICV